MSSKVASKCFIFMCFLLPGYQLHGVVEYRSASEQSPNVCVTTSFYQRFANHVSFYAFFNLRNLSYLICQVVFAVVAYFVRCVLFVPAKEKREQKSAPVNRPPTVLRHCWLVGEVNYIICNCMRRIISDSANHQENRNISFRQKEFYSLG